MVILRREILLKALESVLPGITRKEDTPQSDCFAFKNGEVFTYNGKLSLRTVSGLPKEMEGAIEASEMLDHLRSLKAEEITLEDKENLLLIKTPGQRIECKKEQKFQLSVKDIEIPTEWNKLHEDFLDGLKIVQECAGTNKEEFITVCVHIHPEWLEAFDNFKLCRYNIPTGFEESTIIQKESLENIVGLKATEFSSTDHWTHFKNDDGLIISCQRVVGNYPEVTEYLENEEDWAVIKIPEGLGNRVSQAAISSNKSKDKNITVTLNGEKHRFSVKGEGISTTYRGWEDIDYSGRTIAFSVSPKLLKDITGKHEECLISENLLKVKGDNFVFCSCLSRVVEKDDAPKKKKKKVKVESVE